MELGFGALQLDLAGTTLARRPAAAAARLCGGASGRALDHRPRLEPGAVAGQSFPTAADLDSVVPRPAGRARAGRRPCAGRQQRGDAGGRRHRRDAGPAGGRRDRERPVRRQCQGADRQGRSAADRRRARPALAKAQDILLGYGVTGVGVDGHDRSTIGTRCAARATPGTLKVRLMVYAAGLEVARSRCRSRPPGSTATGCGWSASNSIADGALGSRGAWLKQPYADKPDTRGLQFHSDAELLRIADTAAAARFPDRDPRDRRCSQCADHRRLRAAARANMAGDRRWRIEHAQIVDPADIPRIAPAGIIASMQPTHQTSDRLMAESALGPNRLAGAYAWQTMLKTRCQAGVRHRTSRSKSPNPFPGLSAAISRQDMNGQPPGGWIPSERLTLRAGARTPSPAARLMPASPRTGSARSSRANGPTSSSSTAIRPRSTRSRSRGRRCWKRGSAGKKVWEPGA